MSSQTEAILRRQPRRRRSEGLPTDAGGDRAGQPLQPAAADVLATRLADVGEGGVVWPAVVPAYVAHQGVVLLAYRRTRAQLRPPGPSYHGHRDALISLRSRALHSLNLTAILNVNQQSNNSPLFQRYTLFWPICILRILPQTVDLGQSSRKHYKINLYA